jgi:hypothetical protein
MPIPVRPRNGHFCDRVWQAQVITGQGVTYLVAIPIIAVPTINHSTLRSLFIVTKANFNPEFSDLL